MGLFGFIKNAMAKSVSAHTEEINKIDRACDLPSGWLYANRKFTEMSMEQYHYFESAFFKVGKENGGVRAKHAALKSLVIYMEDLKKVCESKGEWFVRWYSLFIADSDILTSRQEQLKHMEENMDELIQKEKLAKQMKVDLLNIIKEEPGIVQSDLYKRFDAQLKGDVSSELYRLSASGVITREKSGRSYKLYLM